MLLAAAAISRSSGAPADHRSWAADNGNGAYSNPLFYDEFSDPDMIRVGSDYYLTVQPCMRCPAYRSCIHGIW